MNQGPKWNRTLLSQVFCVLFAINRALLGGPIHSHSNLHPLPSSIHAASSWAALNIINPLVHQKHLSPSSTFFLLPVETSFCKCPTLASQPTFNYSLCTKVGVQGTCNIKSPLGNWAFAIAGSQKGKEGKSNYQPSRCPPALLAGTFLS